MRHFSLIIPENTPKDAPLVFVAHGYGNSGKTKTWMDKAAEKEAADFAIRRLKTAGYIRANISLKMY